MSRGENLEAAWQMLFETLGQAHATLLDAYEAQDMEKIVLSVQDGTRLLDETTRALGAVRQALKELKR